MPILFDIMDHDIIGPAIRQGRAEGRQEGERAIVLRQIGQRFGPLPDWATNRLGTLSQDDLNRVAVRLFDAHTLDDLLT